MATQILQPSVSQWCAFGSLESFPNCLALASQMIPLLSNSNTIIKAAVTPEVLKRSLSDSPNIIKVLVTGHLCYIPNFSLFLMQLALGKDGKFLKVLKGSNVSFLLGLLFFSHCLLLQSQVLLPVVTGFMGVSICCSSAFKTAKEVTEVIVISEGQHRQNKLRCQACHF